MAEWITTKQAAELTGYTQRRVRQLAKAGKVKGQRWGRDWQIDQKSILSYVRKAEESGEKRGPKAGD